MTLKEELNKEIENQSHPTEEEVKEAALEVATWIEECLKKIPDFNVEKEISCLPRIFWLIANDILYDYDIHDSMSGLGGCTPLKEWLEVSESRLFFKLIKNFYHKRVIQGWHKVFFREAMYDLGCTIVINFILCKSKGGTE